MQTLLTPNETLLTEFAAESVSMSGRSLAIHGAGVDSKDLSRGGVALVQPMPEGVDPTSPPAAAYRAVRGALAYRREFARVDADKRLSDEGKREKHVEPAAKAVAEVIAAAKDVYAFAGSVEGGARAFYDLPALDKGDAVTALTLREIRDQTRDLPAIELSRLATQNRMVAEAWMRAPLPLDETRQGFVTSAWRAHIDASDPRRAESIAVGERGAEWAKATLRSTARTLAGDLRADGPDVIARVPLHDLEVFNRIFDLPRGEKRLRARLPA